MNRDAGESKFVPYATAEVRAVYERLLARRATSRAFAAIGASVRDACGLLSVDSSLRVGEVERLTDILCLAPASHVLDVGCGSGAPARYLARATGCRVTGVDLTPARVIAARVESEKAGLATRVSFLVADANAPLPFARSRFDATIVLDALIHVARQRALVASLAESLRPGGRLAIVSTTVNGLSAEDAARVQEIPGIWFGSDSEALAESVESAGFTLVSVMDRSDFLRRLHRARLAAMVERNAELERELGAEDTAALIRRQVDLSDLAADGRIGSVLIVATRR